MSSSCDPKRAPVGDVGAALMMVDSRIKAVHAGKSATDPEQRESMDQFLASLGANGLDDLLDGACALICMFMTWLRKAHESEGKDVIEYVVPTLVATVRMMPRSCPPPRGRPNDGRAEATAFLLAEHVNRNADNPESATRMIMDALTSAGGEGSQPR
ncbi:hypothetical protein ACFWOB_28995 [Streptomyces sp. NPDC058420]|uniref:hypothetical protein n=1 Tax=Streptomyces sp. NPDC058420 TaxID=3346489 RepID=UPI00365C31E4